MTDIDQRELLSAIERAVDAEADRDRLQARVTELAEMLAELLFEIDCAPSSTYSWQSPLWKEWANGRLVRIARRARAALAADRTEEPRDVAERERAE